MLNKKFENKDLYVMFYMLLVLLWLYYSLLWIGLIHEIVMYIVILCFGLWIWFAYVDHDDIIICVVVIIFRIFWVDIKE